ncbi:tRNA (adenosine(37)-N6)-threonylcarbamoyltransferase complex dimerization subunit type 1 TsaB [Vibrio pectenicida]|uniref:tRNA threonylcarbamoyladenosine biosynthesis protein TsaB n=1 Tax=Vibrio pectenicida TaxID=62763 RepID=A0A3R9EIU1_9VIBR|nr:tRNA (adenosine(37)-N6)-threonylcarbamoyltransferase complex dimerization subunit type 1 TsaB [Vibrio pectenicida]RSD32481.1 tRNA (adenosine(37)-N6)-threonylcarbamoyltransferase complex dimerization subunit type 1 TsaB [Vibrio pectenicida]
MSAKILALDTATENCSVALLVNDCVYVRRQVAPRDHTKKILPMVDEVLKEAGLRLTDLDALAYGRGPGSFTGVRIGIGIAQGLAFGAELPMIGISTLQAMAQGSFRNMGATHVACAIDARMSEVYWGRFARQEDGTWCSIDEEVVIPPAILADNSQADDFTWMKAGTGWGAYPDELDKVQFEVIQGNALYPDAEDIALLAKFEFEKDNIVTVEDASPVYLRDKVAWKKLPGRE